MNDRLHRFVQRWGFREILAGETENTLIEQRPDPPEASVALYTWGLIAGVSAIVAIAALFIPPTGVSGPTSEQLLAQQNDIVVPQSPEQSRTTVAIAKSDRLPVVNSSEAPKQIDTIMTGTVSTAQDTVNVEQIRSQDDQRYGATIGRSKSVPALNDRYAALRKRAPDLFSSVTPLIFFDESGTDLRADLVAGPFADEREMSNFCRAIKLRLTVDCSPSDYRGEELDISFN